MTQKNCLRKIEKFPDFFAIFVKFSIDSWIRMLKRLNMELARSPRGFSKEIIAVFQKQNTQSDTEIDKNHKILFLERFYAFLSKFSTNFVDMNVEKSQQRLVAEMVK